MTKKLDPQLVLFAKFMCHTDTDTEHWMWQLFRTKRFKSLKLYLLKSRTKHCL